MFDSVSRKDFEAEYERRIKAEAIAEMLLSRVTALDEQVKALISQLERQHKDVLDRFVPAPKDPVPGFGVPGASPSYEEIMRIPAVGKRGVRERNAAARDAKLREEQQDKDKDAGSRRATLLPDEEEFLEKQIPV